MHATASHQRSNTRALAQFIRACSSSKPVHARILPPHIAAWYDAVSHRVLGHLPVVSADTWWCDGVFVVEFVGVRGGAVGCAWRVIGPCRQHVGMVSGGCTLDILLHPHLAEELFIKPRRIMHLKDGNEVSGLTGG